MIIAIRRRRVRDAYVVIVIVVALRKGGKAITSRVRARPRGHPSVAVSLTRDTRTLTSVRACVRACCVSVRARYRASSLLLRRARTVACTQTDLRNSALCAKGRSASQILRSIDRGAVYRVHRAIQFPPDSPIGRIVHARRRAQTANVLLADGITRDARIHFARYIRERRNHSNLRNAVVRAPRRAPRLLVQIAPLSIRFEGESS